MKWNNQIKDLKLRSQALCPLSLISFTSHFIACHLLSLMSLFCYCAALKAEAQSEMCIDSAGGDEKYKIFLKRIKYFSSVAQSEMCIELPARAGMRSEQ